MERNSDMNSGSELYVLGNSNLAEQVWAIGLQAIY